MNTYACFVPVFYDVENIAILNFERASLWIFQWQIVIMKKNIINFYVDLFLSSWNVWWCYIFPNSSSRSWSNIISVHIFFTWPNLDKIVVIYLFLSRCNISYRQYCIAVLIYKSSLACYVRTRNLNSYFRNRKSGIISYFLQPSCFTIICKIIHKSVKFAFFADIREIFLGWVAKNIWNMIKCQLEWQYFWNILSYSKLWYNL